MVSPDVEKKVQVRQVSHMFVTAARLAVPFISVVLRRGYGFEAMAMAAGGVQSLLFTIFWPTGESGGMGLEGAVELGSKKVVEPPAFAPLENVKLTVSGVLGDHGRVYAKF